MPFKPHEYHCRLYELHVLLLKISVRLVAALYVISNFLSMWTICISVLVLHPFSFSPLPAHWRERSNPQLLITSGWWDWGRRRIRTTPDPIFLKERRMKTVLVLLKKNGKGWGTTLEMPTWILLTMTSDSSRQTDTSGHQQEKGASLTWQELEKEPQQLEKREEQEKGTFPT